MQCKRKNKGSVFKILGKMDLKKFGISSVFKHNEGKEDKIVVLKENKLLEGLY